MFSIAILIAVVALLAIAAIVGFIRGTKKSIIRAITIVLAIALTFAFGGAIIDSFGSITVRMDGVKTTMHEFITDALMSNETIASIAEESPILVEAIEKIPALIALIVGSIVTFIVLRLVGLLVYFILAIVLKAGKKRSTTLLSRLGGLAIHLVCAILSIMMVFMPLVGFTSIATQSEFETVANSLSNGGNSVIDDFGDAIYNTPAINIFSNLGAKKLGISYINKLIYLNTKQGEKVGILVELDELVDVLVEAENGKIISNATNNNTEAIFETLKDYDYTYSLCLELLDSCVLRESLPAIITSFVKNYAESTNIPSVVVNPAIDGMKASLNKAFNDTAEKEEVASSLAMILSGVGSIANLSSSLGDLSTGDLIETIGTILGALQANSNLSSFGINLMEIVVNSPEFETYSPMISSIKEVMESGTDIKELSKVVAASMDLMDVVNSSLGSAETIDKASESIKKIINSLDENIATQLKAVVTHDTIKGFGVEEQYVEQISGVVNCVVDELVKASGQDNYDKEAEAIVAIMSTAVNGNSSFTSDDIKTLYNTAATSNVVKNTIKTIEMNNILSIDSTALGSADAFASVINDLYNSSSKSQEDVKILESIANILNVSDKVSFN
ncbi:MAG: hypothetical protein MJ236_01420 [Clostridia bacterium]|nr:hypothetical protein [Clostridia bacterium]